MPPTRKADSLSDPSEKTPAPPIEAGTTVILHPAGPAGGFPKVIRVDHIADGLHWFLGSCDPIDRGEELVVEIPVLRDARYTTRAKLIAKSSETFALQLQRDWERVQQRAFIRITAYGLQVRVVRLNPITRDDADQDPPDTVHDLIDISAGGLRFTDHCDYEHGEEVICHFELPGSLCFVLPASIVRNESDAEGDAKPGMAVEFMGLDENNRSQLLRWVYREQVRRHRHLLGARKRTERHADD